MKRLLSLLLSVALIFALASEAFAAANTLYGLELFSGTKNDTRDTEDYSTIMDELCGGTWAGDNETESANFSEFYKFAATTYSCAIIMFDKNETIIAMGYEEGTFSISGNILTMTKSKEYQYYGNGSPTEVSKIPETHEYTLNIFGGVLALNNWIYIKNAQIEEEANSTYEIVKNRVIEFLPTAEVYGQNVHTLANYIMTNGRSAPSLSHLPGTHMQIDDTFNFDGGTFISMIFYHHEDNLLTFFSTYEIGQISISVGFDYDISLCKSKPNIYVTYVGNGATDKFLANAEFDSTKFSESTILEFEPEENSNIFNADTRYYNELCNESVKRSMKGLEAFLTKATKLKFADIGFANYSASQGGTTPDTPSTPKELSLSVSNGSLGKKVSVQVTGGHWLTVQTKRGNSITVSSIQAQGSGTVTVSFSAAAGSTIQVWETETEMTFSSQGVPTSKILATATRTL